MRLVSLISMAIRSRGRYSTRHRKKTLLCLHQIEEKKQIKDGLNHWLQDLEDIHDRENKLLGFKKSFVFKYKKNQAKGTSGNGHWLMSEFSLRDYSQAEDNVSIYVTYKQLLRYSSLLH